MLSLPTCMCVINWPLCNTYHNIQVGNLPPATPVRSACQVGAPEGIATWDPCKAVAEHRPNRGSQNASARLLRIRALKFRPRSYNLNVLAKFGIVIVQTNKGACVNSPAA
jgi:hypothetical protein